MFVPSPIVSLITTRVSLEVYLPSFEVLNCWLNLVASCLDENNIPLKVIASFSASPFALPSPLIILHMLVGFVFWSMVSTKSQFFHLYTHIRFWVSLFNLGSSCEVGSLLRRTSRLFVTFSISAGTGSSLIL